MQVERAFRKGDCLIFAHRGLTGLTVRYRGMTLRRGSSRETGGLMQTVFSSIVVALILVGAPVAGLADATLDVTGTSSAHVVITTGADGEKTTAVTFRNVRFDSYQVFVG